VNIFNNKIVKALANFTLFNGPNFSKPSRILSKTRQSLRQFLAKICLKS
jgi:hypothetical protein